MNCSLGIQTLKMLRVIMTLWLCRRRSLFLGNVLKYFGGGGVGCCDVCNSFAHSSAKKKGMKRMWPNDNS